MPAWFVQFFFWSFCGREVCGLDNAGGSVFKEYWNFSLKFGRSIKSAIFFEKKFNLIQKLLWSHGLQFWQLCQFCLARNPKDSGSVPKSQKGFVSSRNLSLRMFHWTRRVPYWRICSFLANLSFLRKTNTKYKVVTPSKKNSIKFFLWSHGFCFWHQCRKLLPQIWNFFIQNQKRMSNLFFLEKKPFCLKSFLWTNGMRC